MYVPSRAARCRGRCDAVQDRAKEGLGWGGQCSRAWRGMGDMGWRGIARQGMKWHGVVWGWHGLVWGWHGLAGHRISWRGVVAVVVFELFLC